MMRVDYKAFGKRLREYRLARHLTQEQLGELGRRQLSAHRHAGARQTFAEYGNADFALLRAGLHMRFAPDGFASRTDDLHAAPTPPSSAQHINQLGSGRSAG